MDFNEFEVVDELPNGLKIIQDKRYYRFTSDSVLLSKFARAKTGDKVADFCAGSGIVAFHFYALNKDVKFVDFTLFEMQPTLANLSKKSVELNGFDFFKVENVKIQDVDSKYCGAFSLILCNPPYERGGFDNESYEKAVCRKEITINLAEIVKKASYCLKFGGRLALINRADRLAEVCYTMHEAGIEAKKIQFVSGKEGDLPYLVMVEGVKGGKPCSQILPTIINEKK